VAEPFDPATVLSSALVAAGVSGVFAVFRERYILSRKADIDYSSNARKRLYEAIEPLRLQLLFAARDVADRVQGHVRLGKPGDPAWVMDVDKYYVQSFVFRLLRPLAIGQLIQRQMSIADFRVDERAIDLLRFDESARRLLAGSDVVLDHKADWAAQTDHLFSDNLQVAAAVLLVREASGVTRVMDFAEFAGVLRAGIPPALTDLLTIFGRCKASLLENPIFWLRLVGYGHVCNNLVADLGANLGFRSRPYDREEMLKHTKDSDISANPARYAAAFEAVIARGL
jgi:hypothetical protein